MIQYFSQPTKVHEDFSSWLLSRLGVIDETAKHSMNKEKLWISYHELTASKLFVTKWEAFLVDCSGKVPPLLYQHITDELFEDIIKISFGMSTKLPASESAANVEALSNEEENAIHYVDGYVLRELKKDHSNSSILPLIEKLTISEKRPARIDPSQQWVMSVDRGGLTKITDEAFQCFCDIETAMRRYLKVDNTRDMNEQFSKKVVDAILNDENLLFDWCFAVECIEEEMAKQCLEIIKKWFVIRGFSFTKSVMEIYKQASKKGTDKTKPLWSKIFTESNNDSS